MHDQLAVHHHHGGARGGLGGRIIHGRQRHVVAALGVQADAVARRLCQWQRIGARSYHQRIGGDVALVGLHRLQATARGAQPGGARGDTPHADRLRVRGQRRRVRAGVAAMPGLGHVHGKAVVGRQIGLAHAQRVGVPFGPGDAFLAAHVPGEGVGDEIGAAAVYVQHALVRQQMAGPGALRQILVQQRRALQQATQRVGGAPHLGLRAGRFQIAPQPGQGAWQVGPAQRQRPQWVHQPARHLAPNARAGGRQDGVRRQPTRVAVAGGLFAAGRAWVHQRHIPTSAAQLDRAGQADEARACHHHVARCAGAGGLRGARSGR